MRRRFHMGAVLGYAIGAPIINRDRWPAWHEQHGIELVLLLTGVLLWVLAVGYIADRLAQVDP